MTNLNAVNTGMNKYCGPAVLSILTGKSTDECAAVISSINGKYHVTGVLLTDLLRAADKLGFDQFPYPALGSLYVTLTRIVNDDGMYIVTLPNHFVCIEVNNRKIYFCDNHTKQVMPASSSARLTQKVNAVHKVVRRKPPEVIQSTRYISITVNIYDEKVFDNGTEKLVPVNWAEFKTIEEAKDFINRHEIKESE